ncbi:hypothetical protein EBR78_01340 [bacterium]|nr:hypothetical protein [bacterium]
MKQLTAFILSALWVLGTHSASWALSPRAFLKENPIPKNTLQVAPSSFQTLVISEQGLGELELRGIRAGDQEIFWGKRKISSGKNKKVVIKIPVTSEPEIHELKLVEPDGSTQSYFFELRLSRLLPAPLRVRVRTESGEVIDRFNFGSGTYSADEWIELQWLSEHEVLGPDEFEIRSFERDKKKLQAAIKEEQQELVRLQKERNLLIQQMARDEAKRNQALESGHRRRVSSVFKAEAAPGLSSFQVSQGIGLLSLQQPQQASIDTTQWLLQAEYRKINASLWTTGLFVQGFVLPLKSSASGGNPRYVKAGLDVGAQISLGSQISINPKLGFDYQSLITSSLVGYRNLMGPRLEVVSEMKTGSQSLLKAALFLNLFDPGFQGVLPTNYQWGGRIAYQWEAPLFAFHTFVAGAEWAQMKLNFGTSDLSSSLLQTFVGVQF